MTSDEKMALDTNRAHWDEVAPVHLKSYGIDNLLSGVSRIDGIQKRELYPVADKELVHLQCHIGTDTLSLALDGARVTGVDFSPKSIDIARELAQRMGISAKFVLADVLDLEGVVSQKFDIVYTSKGVLSWIRDIKRWAQTIASLMKDDGVFYMMEGHPTLYMFDETKPEGLEVKYSYFGNAQPLHVEDEHPDYSDKSYVPVNKTYEWMWSLSDIVSALLDSGLRIEMFHEYGKLFYQAGPGMVRTEDGWWQFKDYPGMIPLTFTLKGRKAGGNGRAA